MKSNFYEKLIRIKNEKEKNLLNEMEKLLDESIDSFINLRKREISEIDITNVKAKLIKANNEFHEQADSEINEGNDNDNNSNNNNENNNNNRGNNNNHFIVHLRDRLRNGHSERLRRIRNLEEESDLLARLFNDENIDVIG